MRREIITRRSLPHWYKPGAIYFLQDGELSAWLSWK
ncbi:MAG: hypothetical protein JWM11_1139 [Planctomycetaceae bacterium]|nr:hypothetical protein [Planctomycetaceae bacterium]